jgi:hypothetical protein
MFAAGDESKLGGSDFEPSHIDRDYARVDILGRSGSVMGDNSVERNRYMIDNFDIIEMVSIGSLS